MLTILRCRRKKTSTHNLSIHWVTPINVLTCVLWVQGQAVLLVFCIPSVGDQIPPRTQELPKLIEFTLWVQVTKASAQAKRGNLGLIYKHGWREVGLRYVQKQELKYHQDASSLQLQCVFPLLSLHLELSL